MTIKSLVVITLTLMMLVTSSVILQATTADSSTWLYQQNGVLGDTPDFVFKAAGFTDAGGGILDFAAGYLDSPSWLAQSANLLSNGYTIETRLKITENGNAFGFSIMPGDGGQLSWFDIRTNDIRTNFEPGGLVTWDTSANNDDFHVFRIAHSAGNSKFKIWRDGLLVTDNASMYGPYTDVFINMGNISGTGATGQLDYIRWTVGAYDPSTQTTVPEPSSLVVMVSGLLGISGFVIRRRK